MFRGFVDLQVNGCKGVDFSSLELTAEKVQCVENRLLQRGVLAYCPTVITASWEAYAHSLPILAEDDVSQPNRAKNIGIHLEGPFISPEDGPRGMHPQAHAVRPTIERFERLRELARDRIAILTLAPELPGALKLIEHVVEETQIVVSIGHTAADRDVIQRAIDTGARLATHIGNGLADLVHRHQNPLWPLLADDRLSGAFITDGFHLPADLIRVALRAKTPQRFIVTSDIAHLAGLQPGTYRFHGAGVVLEKNGHLHREGAYQLAGSANDMLDCMNHLAALGDLTEQELYDAGCFNALRLLGIESLPVSGDPEPLVRFDGQRFHLTETER